MRRHFSLLPSQSPGKGASPWLLPCPALPNAGTSAHLRIPSPGNQHHPSVAGGNNGKVSLPAMTLNIVCPYLYYSPYPSKTLFLTSWWWALLQNYLPLRCLYVKELGNPGSQAKLPLWSHILSQTNGLKFGQVHLCSNVRFIPHICWSDGCRFKRPHSFYLSCDSRAGQSPYKSQTILETKQYIISQSKDKVSLSSKGDLQKAKEIALMFSFLCRRPEDRPVKVFNHTPKSRWIR